MSSVHVEPHVGKVRCVVRTAVVLSTTRMNNHSTDKELERCFAATGSPDRSAGMNLSLLAAARPKRPPTRSTLMSNACPYPVPIRAENDPASW